MIEVRIPNNWRPRDYQKPLWRALQSGCHRAVAIWHRRAGKDTTALNWTATQACTVPGVYWHMLPTQKQAKRVVWDGINKNGERIIDQVFPRQIRKSVNKTEMKIETVTGSIWQLCGSDNYNSLVGGNPRGVVFSEWPLTDPAAWDFIRPILAENGGWAIFIYTPRGHNHGWDLYEMAIRNKDWFCQLLTVGDTGAISGKVINEEKEAGMSDDMVNQEFFCSFDAPQFGAYYAKQIKQSSICSVKWEPTIPVDTYWDLGVDDSTTIWFVQTVGNEIHLIDYYECTGEGIGWYVKVLREKPYTYGKHWAPHDIKVRELGTGKSRIEVAAALGLRFFVVPMIPIDDGIQAVRDILPRCYFDFEACKRGVSALQQYHKLWNEATKTFLPRPCHDWTSHAADAFRMLAVAYNERLLSKKYVENNSKADNQYNRYGRF